MSKRISKDHNQPLNTLERISESYSCLGDLRSAIQLFPFGIGSAIDSFFGGRADAINQRRIQIFLEQCCNDIHKLGEDKIDKDFIQSDNFFFFCKNIFRSLSDETDTDKLLYYKNVFLGKINLKNEIEDDFRFKCVEVLKALSVSQIKILSSCSMAVIKRKQAFPATWPPEQSIENYLREKKSLTGQFYLNDANLPQFRQESALSINLNGLCDSGLLRDPDEYDGPDYEITKFGSDFIYTVLIDQI